MKILRLLLATLWISGSEFFRNQILLSSAWTEHYASLGLTFPAAPVNGALWGFWSLLFAGAIGVIATRFTLVQTTLLAWFVGFAMMWVVIGNLGVLPLGILPVALPLSLLEAFGASWILCRRT